MTLAPESVHERVDEFDLRIAVEFGGEFSNQVGERLLKKRIVVARLIFRVRIF